MTCRVTVNDGVNPIVVLEEEVNVLDVAFGRVAQGGSIQRMLSGRGVKQTRFQKKTITVTGTKLNMPTGLRDLDYSQELEVIITTGLGSEIFTCITEPGADETWGLRSGEVTWSLLMEEV